MNSFFLNTLNCLSIGIVITDSRCDIIYWNNYMEFITGQKHDDVFQKNIYDKISGLSKKYLQDLVQNLINNDGKLFFSAAMHKDIIESDRKFNLRISKVKSDDSDVILFEFIDVTNEYLRISQLKNYIGQLYHLNVELKEKEKEISSLAYYDKLTRLANRTLFYSNAEKMLESAKQNQSLLGMIFIDIDNFKHINDKYGHMAGDSILVKVSSILTKAVGKDDLVSRYGGDEFLIVFSDINSYQQYKTIASRIVQAKKDNIVFENKRIDISLSMGISFYPYDGDSIDQLIKKADKAMYKAKLKRGRDNCFCSEAVCGLLSEG